MMFSEYIPPLKSLPAPPRRVVMHWTAGGAKANSVDKEHYHLIVNQDGTISKGVHPIAHNMRSCKAGVPYAAHTGGFNSYSIGVSFAGMKDSSMTKPGPVPLTEKQVLTGLRLIAELCLVYGLNPRSVDHLFTHAEAWRIHHVKGTMNPQKWDIDVLFFKRELKREQVGPWLREQAGKFYDDLKKSPVPGVVSRPLTPPSAFKPRLLGVEKKP